MAGGIVQEKALDVQRGTQGEDDSQCSTWVVGSGQRRGTWGMDVGDWLQQSDVS